VRKFSYLPMAVAVVYLSVGALLSPAIAQVFSNARVNAYQQQKDWAGLARYATAWTQAEPNNLDAWSALAVAESTTGLNQPSASISAFKHALAIKPDFAAAWDGLGINEVAAGQPAAAVDAIQHAVRLAPNDPSYLNNLAAAYREENDIGSALKALDNELPLAQRMHDFATWFELGNAYSALHDATHALQAYKETVALKPDFAEAQRDVAALEQYTAPPASSARRGPGLNYSTCSGPYANPACAHTQFGDRNN
jgi:tetratricopeptide (TPR) repeat protein